MPRDARLLAAPLSIFSPRVFTPQGLRPALVRVVEGRIDAVLEPSPGHRPDLEVPCLIPGVVDTHVHVNEPGRTDWEGFATATRAAAAGGITTLVDMPLNSDPVTTSLQALRIKRAAAGGQCWVDVGFWGGVVPGNASELEPMIDAGILGFKCFLIHSGIDDFPQVTEADLRQAMPILARRGIPLLVHAELCRPDDVLDPPGSRRYQDFLDSRPGRWEIDAIALMVRLCRETGCAVHIVHLACADALPLVAAARAEGLPFSAETCPHYLCFASEEIEDGRTEFKCCPPIRTRENRERLWHGLREGTLEFVVCDHSPCTPDLKRFDTGDFMAAWGGIASLQLSLAVVWGEARARGFSLEQVLTWLGPAPARLAGLQWKGCLVPGADADLVAWDPDAEVLLEAAQLFHRHPVTPYLGRKLTGRVLQTWLRGHPVVVKGELEASPCGRLLVRGQPVVEGENHDRSDRPH